MTAEGETPPPRGWRPVVTRWSQAGRSRTDWAPAGSTLAQVMRGARWGALAVWVAVLALSWSIHGIPFDRTGLLLWIGVGLVCVCVGRHPVWMLWVLVDFLPLAAVLIAYDRLRGWSDTVGLPTWWTPQIAVDKFLFFGHEPTVWLQEHLKDPQVQWYDVVVCICYYSFFFLPYLTAGVLWLRSRRDFYRWTGRFVGLSFLGFALFVLVPAAPPWAAARCTSLDVAGHPNNPWCMWYGRPQGDGLLGAFSAHRPGANPYVELITTRGFSKLHLSVADSIIDQGRAYIDNVAAVPSLHVGGTVLFVLFMWRRVNRWWRPLLAFYPFLMLFSLVYGADHYVCDGIAGALCAALVHWLGGRVERRLGRRRPPDTLDGPPRPTLESPCPPTHPQPETTPSST